MLYITNLCQLVQLNQFLVLQMQFSDSFLIFFILPYQSYIELKILFFLFLQVLKICPSLLVFE